MRSAKKVTIHRKLNDGYLSCTIKTHFLMYIYEQIYPKGEIKDF